LFCGPPGSSSGGSTGSPLGGSIGSSSGGSLVGSIFFQKVSKPLILLAFSAINISSPVGSHT
jgi:hypothetical protein